MNPHYLSGNQLTLLQNSTDYLPALTTAIDQATTSIYLESYIFQYDAAGQHISAALMRAAARGVTTHLLLDGFGSAQFPPSAREILHAAGVQVLVYRPKVSPFPVRKHRLRRMHRKLAVIDGQIAFIGGINIIDDTTTTNGTPQFDFAVSVMGPVVPVMQRSMITLYALVAWTQLRVRFASTPPGTTAHATGRSRVAFLERSNWRHRRDIERAYLRAIGKAHDEILLANAYFLPSGRFRRALIHAAQRGVRVQLLLQGAPEYRWVQHATRAMYDELLAANIRIYEYQPSVLHAKVAVIDRKWVTVGSSNIEPTSLFLAREANVAAFDRDVATELRARLMDAIDQDAREVTREDRRHTPLLQRWVWRFAYAGVRLLAAWVGYGREME